MKTTMIRVSAEMIFGGFLGWVVSAVGGWDAAIKLLAMLMAVDYISGLICAAMGKSQKTKKGGLKSAVMLIGLVRKGMIIAIVMICNQADITLGVQWMRLGAIFAFSANELLSLIENMGLLGVPMPPQVVNLVDVLKTKGEQK